MTSSGFVSGASNLRVTVSDIAARDALIPSLTLGDLVPVANDGSGSPNVYQFNGSGFDTLGDVGTIIDSILNPTSTNPVENQAIVVGLALKVDVGDIIDNLATVDPTKPLSANQGKVIKDLIEGKRHTITVPDIAARDALTGLNVDDQVFVLDFNGSGHWARYRVQSTTDGTGANSVFDLLIDETQIAPLNAAQVKALYESNSDTNAFTDAEQTKLGGIATGAQINVQADWNETNAGADSFIQNKPNLTGLTVSTLGGQPMLTLVDTTRGNKMLSVAEVCITWAENDIDNDAWLRIPDANDDEASIVLPFNATVVSASAYCTNADNKTKEILAYVEAASQGSIGTLSGSAADSFITPNLNIDLNAEQRFRLRGNSTGGKVQRTIVNVFFKWRV